MLHFIGNLIIYELLFNITLAKCNYRKLSLNLNYIWITFSVYYRSTGILNQEKFFLTT